MSLLQFIYECSCVSGKVSFSTKAVVDLDMDCGREEGATWPSGEAGVHKERAIYLLSWRNEDIVIVCFVQSASSVDLLQPCLTVPPIGLEMLGSQPVLQCVSCLVY